MNSMLATACLHIRYTDIVQGVLHWRVDHAASCSPIYETLAQVTRRPAEDAERAEVAHLERLAQYMVHLESS